MELSKGLIISLSSISAFIIMFVVLYVQWRIEREANSQRQAFIFHVFNVMTMTMFYGVTYMSFLLMNNTFSHYGGSGDILLQATAHPLPFIIIVYVIASYFYNRYIRPVVKVKGTNVVVMRRKWHNLK